MAKLVFWQRRAIAEAFEAGEKADALAAEFGITKQYVGQLHKLVGFAGRPTGRPRRKSKVSLGVIYSGMLSTSAIGTVTVIG